MSENSERVCERPLYCRSVKAADFARLFALAAIWGGSFIFMRVTAPALGAFWIAEGRILIGGLALLAWFRLTGFDPQWRRNWRVYAIIGVINSAVPFTLFGFASTSLPASTMAFLNATSPMFGMVLGALIGTERITLRRTAGLLAGAGGVALVAGPEMSSGPLATWAIGACLCAAFFYGLTGIALRHYGADVPGRGVAVGSQLAGAAALAPFLPFTAPAGIPSPLVLGNLAALGLLASGVAFLIYFRLMVEVGATRALTVTFLVPLFAVLCGAAFLGESLSLAIAAGGMLILAGTLLVTRV